MHAKARLLALLRPEEGQGGGAEAGCERATQQLPQLPTRPRVTEREQLGSTGLTAVHPYHASVVSSGSPPRGMQSPQHASNAHRHLSSLHAAPTPKAPERVLRSSDVPASLHTYSVDALDSASLLFSSLSRSAAPAHGAPGHSSDQLEEHGSRAEQPRGGRERQGRARRGTELAEPHAAMGHQASRTVQRGGKASRQPPNKRTSAPPPKKRGFDLSLGPAHDTHNRKLRQEALALTDERILQQRRERARLLRASKRRGAVGSAAPLRPSYTSTAGRMVLSAQPAGGRTKGGRETAVKTR